MDFRPTLNLPDPGATIPMKANLPGIEPAIAARWREEGLYGLLQERRKGDPLFVLHDGPPYTNSPIHIGTALNKVLKDMVLKSRSMMGFRTPYVPGFDNHGLPIEQAVARSFAERKVEPTLDELRKACRAHAARFITVQTEQFERLGVLGLWSHPYTTMDPRFEAGIVRVFGKLLAKGYVYRGLRPTLWSPTSRTALADTEIVYKEDYVSKAIYVAFPLRKDALGVLKDFPDARAVIWTTTPWTIPSNQALAFGPEMVYAVVRVGGAHFVVARDLVERLAPLFGWSEYEVVAEVPGAAFEGMTFSHPVFDRPSLGVLADYVAAGDGTGIVHTAPSHGRDDFFTGLKYDLPVPNTVDERGVMTAEAGEFDGTHFKAADTVVVDRLRDVGALLRADDFRHSYPHAERDEMPVIFRATEQWFVSLSHDDLRGRALEEIPEVAWTPETGESRITAMVQNRPDWCVSRQRPWGVGIPILYTRKGRKPVDDPAAIEAIAALVEREGSDAWFTREPSEFLPKGYAFDGESEFDKETDVLDVWFDSGSTSLLVLTGEVYPEWESRWPADLYLEGSDQHRGWFNSSLLLGTAIKDTAPYKAVLTHGFVVDESGRKMSKRLGNVVDPVEASERFGADVVRLWTCSVDYQSDAPCSMKILEQVGGLYRDLRNTLRFLLGNLAGYDGSAPLLPMDEWILGEAESLCAEVVGHYEAYEFTAALSAMTAFCRERLSKLYLDAIKDRMYCDLLHSPERRSGARACAEIARRLILLLAPVLAFTAEEAWERLCALTGEPRESVHLQLFVVPDEARLLEIEGSDLAARFEGLVLLRERVNAAFEPFKGTDSDGHGAIKNSQEVVVHLPVAMEPEGFTKEEIANFLRVSWVEFSSDDEGVSFTRSRYLECARSRVRRPDVEEVVYKGETVPLSRRDRRVLEALS